MPIETTYQKSKDLLTSLSTDAGFNASSEDMANYKRIWARDGIIAGLASLQSGDSALINAFEKTLNTLKKYQDKTGRIPSNVSVEEGKVSYGTTVGRIDATLWYVIGVCQLSLRTDNPAFFAEFKDSVEKALFYLSCLELNGRGFIYIPHGGDWADEYINHGYVLYDELLYYFALSGFASLTNQTEVIQKKDFLKESISVNFLPSSELIDDPHVYHKKLYEKMVQRYAPPLPIAYFSNHSIRTHTDTFAISLFMLSGMAEGKENLIRENLKKLAHDQFPILPAFHPVIQEGSHNWEHLQYNNLFTFRNEPYEYHNGGLWPLVHGFFLSTFDSSEGMRELEKFSDVLARDNFLFPEYYNGKTFEPKGVSGLGLSAAAYLMAYESIKNKKKVL